MNKIMTIVGTRPELIKMSRVIHEFDQHTSHILVHTGQNYDYELNEVFFNDLEIRKPNYFLDTSGKNAAQTISNVISKSDEIIEIEKPDAILLYGDTNSCLAVIAAKRRKIPIFHMEAGNRCFDQRVPEELNRKIIDHLSDINLVLTEHARRYLIAEGIPAETIIKTGSHMNEVITYYKEKILESTILEKLNLQKNKYFIVSAHREENVDDDLNLTNLIQSLNVIAEKYNLPIIVSTHPRTKKRLQSLNLKYSHDLINFSKPFGFFDYLKMQINAKCVISDSGTITEEASLLKFPAITIRNTHERPEGMDEGILIMSDISPKEILNAISIITKHYQDINSICPVLDYNALNVSKKILRIVSSYINYVNKTVWKL
jgi:UDP-N-acetyl-L-fucosamine synthase